MNKMITSKMGNTSMPDIKFTIQNKQQQFSIYYLDNQDLYWTGQHILMKKRHRF